MIELFTVKPDEFNQVLADHLKNTSKVNPPKNVDLIKTCHGKQRAPCERDWYYKRAASIVRKMLLAMHADKNVGVRKLSSKYGCSKNRGSQPSKHVDGSRGLIRRIMQDLEKADWIVKEGCYRKISDVALSEMKQLIEKIRA